MLEIKCLPYSGHCPVFVLIFLRYVNLIVCAVVKFGQLFLSNEEEVESDGFSIAGLSVIFNAENQLRV